MKRTLCAVLMVMLAGSLLLTGCPQPTPTPTTTSPTPTPTTTSPTTTTPTDTGSGVLHLYAIDPITLDPAVSGESTSHEYVLQIYSGLLRLDDELDTVPDIAASWDVSPDHRTYTFYLREDVCFHDGKPVTAADFKYSWERACDPATGSGSAATYLGDIVGVAAVLAGETADISGVKVRGDYTLEVTIDAPKSYFLAKLTYPTAFVVDEANVAEGAEWWRQPNGTGPFKLAEWQETERLRLVRYDNYYGEKASLAEVDFQLWSGVPMRMYENGEIDVAGVSVTYIDRVTDPAGPFLDQLQSVPELSLSYIGFNTTRPPFDDVNIRLAFAMAVDKEKIVSLSLRDLVQVAGGILPPGMPGYNEQLDGLEYDPAQARELIAASAYGDAANLPPITLTTTGYGGYIGSTLEAIITQWRENLGVEVTVRQIEPERFLYHLDEELDELFDAGWIADYPHPQNFLDILFRTGSEHNEGGYSNPALDALLDEAATEPDEALSLELYQQAEQMLVDDAAVMPLWFGQSYYLVKPRVRGYQLTAMGFAWLNQVSVVE
jgi:oligopeptide transport system substrate-binding protein